MNNTDISVLHGLRFGEVGAALRHAKAELATKLIQSLYAMFYLYDHHAGNDKFDDSLNSITMLVDEYARLKLGDEEYESIIAYVHSSYCNNNTPSYDGFLKYSNTSQES